MIYTFETLICIYTNKKVLEYEHGLCFIEHIENKRKSIRKPLEQRIFTLSVQIFHIGFRLIILSNENKPIENFA